jgi:CheY-like chemotaxis protein
MLPPIILCIDDRPEMLKIRKTSLEHLGYQVETASNVTNAISAAATLPISVVLLDYKLEGMDAQAIAHQLKQRFPTVPIILLSAYSEMPAALLWLVDEYVMKSEPVERLSGVIDKVVSVTKVRPRSDSISSRLSAAV